MRRLLTLAIATALFAALAVPASARPAWSEKSDATIVETAVALSGTPFEFDDNNGDFDILVAAVILTEADVDVLNGDSDYTVFAPTDAAFIDLANALGAGIDPTDTDAEAQAVAAILPLGTDTILSVLAYHIADGVRNSKSVVNPPSVTMIDGNEISARSGQVEAIGSTAGFVATDIRVADGMIHVIDTVLLPFVP